MEIAQKYLKRVLQMNAKISCFKFLFYIFSLTYGFQLIADDGCSDFAAMKNKMNSVVRAYQCSNASSLEECKKFLGVGEIGQITLAALAAGAIGKKIVSHMRPENYVLCPLDFKTSQNRLTFDLNYWVLHLIFGQKVLGACFRQEPVIQRNLYWGVDGDIKTINDKIKATKGEIAEQEKQKKAESEPSSTKARPESPDFTQIEEVKNKKETIEKNIEALKKEMADDKLVPQIAADLKRNHKEIDRKIEELISAAKKTAVDPRELNLRLYDILKPMGLSEEQMANYFTPLAKRLKAIATSEKLKQKLIGLEYDLDRMKNGQTVNPNRASDVADTASDIDNKMVDNHKLVDLLEEKKKALEKIRASLDLSKNLSADQLTEMAHQIYNTEAFGDQTAHHLMVSGNILEGIKREAEFAAQKNTRFGGGASRATKVPVLENGKIRASLNLKAMFVKSILGVASSIVGMEAASAANLEKPVEAAVSAFDPTSIFYAEDLGGSNCGDMVPSVLIARDPEKGCFFNMEFTPKVYETFLKAEDFDLESLFKDPGVCEFITKNYDNYYPRSTMKPVNCSSPNVVIDFNNRSSINVGRDSFRFLPPNQETSIKYNLDPKVSKKFTFIAEREQHSLAADTMRERFPEHYAQASKMMAAAVEIEACCNLSGGAMPSESDCGRYGINSTGSSRNLQNRPHGASGGVK